MYRNENPPRKWPLYDDEYRQFVIDILSGRLLMQDYVGPTRCTIYVMQDTFRAARNSIRMFISSENFLRFHDRETLRIVSEYLSRPNTDLKIIVDGDIEYIPTIFLSLQSKFPNQICVHSAKFDDRRYSITLVDSSGFFYEDNWSSHGSVISNSAINPEEFSKLSHIFDSTFSTTPAYTTE